MVRACNSVLHGVALAVFCLPSAGYSGEPEADREPRLGGPLQNRCEYVACLRAKERPEKAFAILRTDPRGRESRIIGGWAHDLISVPSGGKEELRIWLVAVDPEGIVYEVEPEFVPYQLRRIEAIEKIRIPAFMVASFIGVVSEVPVLYDARTGFADRPVTLKKKDLILNAPRARTLLREEKIPLGVMTEIDGRSYLLWTDQNCVKGKLERKEPEPSPVLIVNYSADTAPRNGPMPRHGPVTIDKGQFALEDFLKVIANERHIPIYSRSKPESIKKIKIAIINELAEVKVNLIINLLSLNGITLTEQDLTGVGKILLIDVPLEK